VVRGARCNMRDLAVRDVHFDGESFALYFSREQTVWVSKTILPCTRWYPPPPPPPPLADLFFARESSARHELWCVDFPPTQVRLLPPHLV
jgi:hypothetical protein